MVVLTSGMFHSTTMGGCAAENQALMLGYGPKTTFSVPVTQHNMQQPERRRIQNRCHVTEDLKEA